MEFEFNDTYHQLVSILQVDLLHFQLSQTVSPLILAELSMNITERKGFKRTDLKPLPIP